MWYFKRHNTPKSSAFGSYFISMKQSVDLIEALKWKFRTMDVPIEETTRLSCDNNDVVISITTLELTLKLKNTSIS